MTFSYNFENVFETLAGLEFEISFLFGFLLSRGIIEAVNEPNNDRDSKSR